MFMMLANFLAWVFVICAAGSFVILGIESCVESVMESRAKRRQRRGK